MACAKWSRRVKAATAADVTCRQSAARGTGTRRVRQARLHVLAARPGAHPGATRLMRGRVHHHSTGSFVSLTPLPLCLPGERNPKDVVLLHILSRSINDAAHVPHNAIPYKHPQDGCTLSPAQVRTRCQLGKAPRQLALEARSFIETPPTPALAEPSFNPKAAFLSCFSGPLPRPSPSRAR